MYQPLNVFPSSLVGVVGTSTLYPAITGIEMISLLSSKNFTVYFFSPSHEETKNDTKTNDTPKINLNNLFI